MAAFGETFRQARAHKGVTLREAEARTRISRLHLGALEEENFGALPPPIYTRGIIRKYADYLELEAGDMLEMYRAVSGDVAAPAVPDRQSHGTAMPQHVTPNFAVIGFSVIVAAIIFAWGYSIWLTPSSGVEPTPTSSVVAVESGGTAPSDDRPTPPAAPTAAPTEPPIATEPPAIVNSSDNARTAAEPTATTPPTDVAPTPEPTQPPANEYTTGIAVTTSADANVTITVDGAVVFDGIVSPGTQTEVFTGSNFVVTSSQPSVTYFINSCGDTSSQPMSASETPETVEFSANENSCPAP